MDPAQFQNYTIGLAQQETERRAIQTTREQIRDLIRQTHTCDGSSTSAVRNWIREVTLAFNQVGAASIIEIASKTVSGPLRFELQRFIERTIAANQIGRDAIPWPDLRDHLASNFLNIDETAPLRDELDKVRQSAYEPTQQFVRRFQDISDICYPSGLRNPDQESVLIRTFARGLTYDSLAQQLIEQAAPTSLDEAITATIRFCERNDAYGRLGRHESPMEIGAANVSSCKTTEPLVTMVDSLACTVEKLATKLAKIEARHDPRPPPTTTRRRRLAVGTTDACPVTPPAGRYRVSIVGKLDIMLVFVDCATYILSRRETGLRLRCHKRGKRSTHGHFDSIWRKTDRFSRHRSQRVTFEA